MGSGYRPRTGDLPDRSALLQGAALFLYSQGQAADLKDMTVTEIQVISSTGVTYSLPGGTGSDRYRVVIPTQ